MTFLRYDDAIERPKPDEAETVAKIIASMTREGETTAARYGHAVRVSHAKSTALLKGELRPLADLPEPYRQGLFASPDPHPVAIRMAQGPGELLKDDVSTHRGMALKVFGAQGPKLPGHDADTQDFVLATGPVFPNPDAASFLTSMHQLEAGTHAPEAVKHAVSSTAKVLGGALESIGVKSPTLDFFGHKPHHPLAEPYFSQAAIRYGAYVGKVGVYPSSPNLVALADAMIDVGQDPDAFRHAVVAFFAREAATFDLRVQLCTDLDSMPVEDASVPWPEDASPYRTVARITVPVQDAYSSARQKYFDDVLSFRPAHSLAAFRPLGSVMRARLQTYVALSEFRHARNRDPQPEPRSIDEIPD